ncbi:MAG: SurA N-terminal domain-containing protein [Candidatus Omnitrophica bacterium]|nr:SurA N-terminal domain-containing protein [Candidatus Omnitrophota bacterium]
MLDVFRKKKFQKRTLLAILILIIPAFVLWGVGNITQKNTDFVGTIGGKKICRQDFYKSMKGLQVDLMLNYFKEYTAYSEMIRNRPLMKQMAWDRLVFLIAAEKSRLRVSDRDVLAFLSVHPVFVKNGEFDPTFYNYVIRNTFQMEPRQFEEMVRENMEIMALKEKIFSSIKISDKEVYDYFNLVNTALDISFLEFGTEAAKSTREPSAAELEAYYRSHSAEFLSSPKIMVEYAELKYKYPDEKQKTMDTLAKIYNAGTDTLDLAGTAKTYGMRYEKTALVPLEDIFKETKFAGKLRYALRNINKDELSNPVFQNNDAEGFAYIMRKLDELPSELRTFDEVKDLVRDSIIRADRSRIAKEKADAAYKKIIERNLPIQEASKQENLQIFKGKDLTVKLSIDNLGPAAPILEKAAGLKEGSILEPVTLPGGTIITWIDAVKLPAKEDFEKQKELLYRNISMKKRTEALQKWFNEKSPKAERQQVFDEL